jgi:putative phosphoesterase
MRVIAVSDTHGSPDLLLAAVKHAGHTDALLHAGDGIRDCAVLDGQYDGRIYMVRGNCDFIPCEFFEHMIPLESAVIYLTHGHLFDAKATLNKLWFKGREVGADIVCFGHTHVPLLEKQGKVTLLNPGSLRHGKTYGLIEIKGGKADISIISLKD